MPHYCSYYTCFNDAIGGFCYKAEKAGPNKGAATSLQYRWIFWCEEHEEGERRITEGIAGQYYDLTEKADNAEVEALRMGMKRLPPAG